MNIISTDKAPAAIGPYSQAIEVNGFLYSSGQIGVDPETGNLRATLEEQAQQVFSNIDAVLTAAGFAKTNVVKSTIFITNMSEYLKVNELYETFFGDHKPARSTVEVAGLPKGALIEIEVIAVK